MFASLHCNNNTLFDVWSVFLYRFTETNLMKTYEAFENIQCMAIFYYDHIMPCINDRYGDTRTSEKLSVFCNFHEEVFAFFLLAYNLRNLNKNLLDEPFFLKPGFEMGELSQEIQKIVQDFIRAHQGVLKLFEKSKKIKLPRSDNTIFHDEVYRPLGCALFRLRKLNVNLRNEAKMIDILVEEEVKRSAEPHTELSELSVNDVQAYADVDFSETYVAEEMYAI